MLRSKIEKPKPKRKSPEGISTNDLVFSSYQGTSDDIFPQILSLYVKPGSTIADTTFGKGVFWKKIPKNKYNLLPTDIQSGIDCRNLPYDEKSLDVLVLDPPYMHTPGGTTHSSHQNFENYYRNNAAENDTNLKYHEAVLDLYFKAGKEALRVLNNNGIMIVKCADEVCSNQQRLTHIEIINEYTKIGFVVEDLFILTRNSKPGVSRMIAQRHARKNHSFFIIFRKSKNPRWKGHSTTK